MTQKPEKLGFTGTQASMSFQQKNVVKAYLLSNNISEVHHGDCIGADADFHDIVRKVKEETKIIIHPPDIDVKRAFKDADKILDAKPYLDRNRDIVNNCDTLLVCPKTFSKELRSGTWATYRYALKQKTKLILIIWPNGEMEPNINYETEEEKI
jgi:hypothetical protein